MPCVICRTRRRREGCCMSLPFRKTGTAEMGNGLWRMGSAVGRALCTLLPAAMLTAPISHFPFPISTPPTLRVCADPNNLPYSNAKREGFENRLAGILASELGTRVEYTWWSQRRGFVRNTLNAGTCDVIMGVPTGF